MRKLIPLFALAFFAGCSTMNGGSVQPKDCALLEIVATDPLLVAKCAKAPDPLKDEACISISVMRTAAAICYAQAGAPPPAP